MVNDVNKDELLQAYVNEVLATHDEQKKDGGKAIKSTNDGRQKRKTPQGVRDNIDRYQQHIRKKTLSFDMRKKADVELYEMVQNDGRNFSKKVKTFLKKSYAMKNKHEQKKENSHE